MRLEGFCSCWREKLERVFSFLCEREKLREAEGVIDLGIGFDSIAASANWVFFSLFLVVTKKKKDFVFF